MPFATHDTQSTDEDSDTYSGPSGYSRRQPPTIGLVEASPSAFSDAEDSESGTDLDCDACQACREGICPLDSLRQDTIASAGRIEEDELLEEEDFTKLLDGIFSRISSMPTIPPREVFQKFRNFRTESREMKSDFGNTQCLLLTRLFYAIGSPDAITWLRGALSARGCHRPALFMRSKNIISALKTYEELRDSMHLEAISSRAHLVTIFRMGEALRRKIEAANSGTSTVDSIEKMLMTEIHPGLKLEEDERCRYNLELENLTSRLLAGSRWSALVEEFSVGILALLPTGGSYGLSESDFEQLPLHAFHALSVLLKECRGTFLQALSSSLDSFASERTRYPFESLDATSLQKVKYDSLRLLELCES